LKDGHCTVLGYRLTMTGSPAGEFEALTATLAKINSAVPVSASLFDYRDGRSWAFDGGRWFHAASTIKVAILASLYPTLSTRGLTPRHRLPIRNQFVSVVDGAAYSVMATRDTDAGIHAAVDQTMSISELAHRMIAISSNLATNLLLEFIGTEHTRRRLAEAGVTGVELVRGVEDDRAFDAGISNRVTANGLVTLLRAIVEGRFGSQEDTQAMIAILCAQTFSRGLPAGLPPPVRASARIAHKTGEISTATHDAGIVFLEGRAPYVLAVLTGASGSGEERYAPIAQVSDAVFEAVSGPG
jgi:beta-lactamase class A